MSSPARRAFLLLRHHFLLLSGPWLAVSAAGSIVGMIVWRIMIRFYPLVDWRALQAASFETRQAVMHNSMVGNYIRLGADECVQIIEYAFKVIALSVMVLLVARVAAEGTDTFSAALERLRKIPAVIGTLLKFYLIALAIGLGTVLIATLPVLLVAPLAMQWHISVAPLVKWVPLLSTRLAPLLFVLCVMPFLLDFVWRLQQSSSSDDDVPEGLLPRALAYGAVAVVAEILLALAMRSLRTVLSPAPATGASIGQNLIGLVTTLITALPAIACIVAIAVMVMDAAQPVAEEEPA